MRLALLAAVGLAGCGQHAPAPSASSAPPPPAAATTAPAAPVAPVASPAPTAPAASSTPATPTPATPAAAGSAAPTGACGSTDVVFVDGAPTRYASWMKVRESIPEWVDGDADPAPVPPTSEAEARAALAFAMTDGPDSTTGAVVASTRQDGAPFVYVSQGVEVLRFGPLAPDWGAGLDWFASSSRIDARYLGVVVVREDIERDSDCDGDTCFGHASEDATRHVVAGVVDLDRERLVWSVEDTTPVDGCLEWGRVAKDGDSFVVTRCPNEPALRFTLAAIAPCTRAAVTALEAERRASAERDAGALPGEAPTTAEGWLAAGRKALGDERFAAAVSALRHALELAPDMPKLRGELGWALFRAGALGEARSVTEEALAKATTEASKGALLYNLGRIAEADGRIGDAIASYQRSLEARPSTSLKKRLARLGAPKPTLAALLPLVRASGLKLEGTQMTLGAHAAEFLPKKRTKQMHLDCDSVVEGFSCLLWFDDISGYELTGSAAGGGWTLATASLYLDD